MVGSGVNVETDVAVLSTGRDVDVDSICTVGVDTAGLAQANINITNVDNRGMIRFMIPLFVDKTKKGGEAPPLWFTNIDYRLIIRFGIPMFSLACPPKIAGNQWRSQAAGRMRASLLISCPD